MFLRKKSIVCVLLYGYEKPRQWQAVKSWLDIDSYWKTNETGRQNNQWRHIHEELKF